MVDWMTFAVVVLVAVLLLTSSFIKDTTEATARGRDKRRTATVGPYCHPTMTDFLRQPERAPNTVACSIKLLGGFTIGIDKKSYPIAANVYSANLWNIKGAICGRFSKL